MTKRTDEGQEQRSRCQWCRRVLPDQRIGRPRKFCSQSCRQWHWVGRQRAVELQLDEDELHDELYVLACAVNDAERDLAAAGTKPSARELAEILQWVLDAARPVRDRELHPDGPHRP